MKKLNLAIIGQGRSGKDIHGAYYRSERNVYYNVKYVVEFDERRRRESADWYPGSVGLSDYRELFDKKDIDLVVNASYSDMHFNITKDLLEHGFNVLTEKPFAKTRLECDILIETAKKNNVVLAVFQNSQVAPFYLHAQQLIKDGVLGDIKQVNVTYSGFSRRWDWQTLQKKIAGSAYNTGPHPVAIGLGFLDFDKDFRVAYSKLDSTDLTSGDSDDYCKIILTAPNKPVVDIEINSTDAFSNYNLKIQGSKGTLMSTPWSYKLKYIKDGENPPQPLIEESLQDKDGNPLYCSEKLITHEEEKEYEGTAFDVGTANIYESVYKTVTTGAPLAVPVEWSKMTINVIETCHVQNPLPVKFL